MTRLLRPPLLGRSQTLNLYQPKTGDGCVLWLPGQDDAYSSTIRDRSGYGNNGTITAALWKRLPSGLWYLDFDGTDDNIQCSDSTNLNITTAITLMGWFYREGDGTGALDALMGKSLTSSYAAAYPRTTYKPTIYLRGITPTDSFAADTAIPLAAWFHWAFTYNGALMQFYLNGATDGNLAGTGNIGTSNTVLQIGSIGDRDYWLNGYAALLFIGNRALSTVEVADHRQQTRHLFGV